MTFSLAEQIVLAALVLATAGLFGRDLWSKIRMIAAGAPDRDRTDRLGARALTVVREVLFQSRVIGGRPIVGTMHAMVFLGFLVFAFETLDHFLEAFGVPFLEPLLGGALPYFRGLLLVASVLVSVGILGLFYRRFFMRKISPDPESYSSGVVAILIFLLMLTYINGVLEPPLWERANWWLHALIIIVFPQLILRSKHFHIVMAPADIFFRTHRLGDFLPLNLDLESPRIDGRRALEDAYGFSDLRRVQAMHRPVPRGELRPRAEPTRLHPRGSRDAQWRRSGDRQRNQRDGAWPVHELRCL